MVQAQPGRPMATSRSPNALHWIGGVAAVGATLWWWYGFTGPFRWLVDLQVALTGRFYWEPLAVGVLLTALLLVAQAAADVLDPLVPRVSQRTWLVLVILALLGGSAVALAVAWHKWTAPVAETRPVPPLRIIDLDRIDRTPLPFGPVRILGTADPAAAIKLHQEPRGYRTYQPIAPRHSAAAPLPVIAVCSSRYGGNCRPEPLEGWLYRGDPAERDSYRLRRAGLVTAGPFYLLAPDLPKSDRYAVAGEHDPSGALAIVMLLAIVWFSVVFAFIKSPPTPAGGQAPTPPVATQVSPEHPRHRYLVPPAAGAFAFVLLSVLGIIRWVIGFLP